MALPFDLGNSSNECASSHWGGVLVNGSTYYVVAYNSTGHKIQVFRSTAPSTSWTLVETSADTTDPVSLHCCEDFANNQIGILTAKSTVMQFTVYNTSSNTFTTTRNQIRTSIGQSDGLFVAKRASDWVVLRQAATENIMGTNYDRTGYQYGALESGGGTVGGIDDAGSVHYRMGSGVKGASNKVYAFYEDSTNSDLHCKSFNSSNSLSSVKNLDSSTLTTWTSGNKPTIGRGVYFDSSGTEKIRVPYLNTSNKVNVAKVDNDGSGSTDANASDNTTTAGSFYLSVTGTTYYLTYINSSNSDVYYDINANDAGWGTDVSAKTGTYAAIIWGSMSDSTKIFLCYKSTTIFYDEILLTTTQNISPSLFTNAPTLYAPTLVKSAYPLVAPLLTNPPTLYAPGLKRVVQPGLLNNTATVYAPTLVKQPYNLVAPILNNTPTLYAPGLQRVVQPGLLTNSPTLYAPGLQRIVQPGILNNAATLYAPAWVKQPYNLVAPLLEETPTLYAPSMGQLITAPLLTNSPTFYGPTLEPGQVIIIPSLFTSSPTLELPTLYRSPYPLVAPVLTSSTTLYSPGLQRVVQPGLLTNSPVLYAPAFQYVVHPGLFNNPPTLYAPALQSVLQPGLWDNAAALYNPTLYKSPYPLIPGLLDNTATLYNPAFSQEGADNTFVVLLIARPWAPYGGQVGPFFSLEAPVLENPVTLFAPVLSQGPPKLLPPFLDNTAQLYVPDLFATYDLTAPLLTNTPTLYSPAFRPRNVLLVPHLSQTIALYNPALSVEQYTLVAPLSAAVPTLHIPAMVRAAYPLSATKLSETATLYAPTWVKSAYRLSASHLQNSVTLHIPGLKYDQSLIMPIVNVTPLYYSNTMRYKWVNTDLPTSDIWRDVDFPFHEL